MGKDPIVIYWFRRDLRLSDNSALFHALKASLPVVPIFIFDPEYLKNFSYPPKDRRVQFIHQKLKEMNIYLWEKFKSGILTFYSKPEEAFEKLMKDYDIKGVYFNNEYELYSLERDKRIERFLKRIGIVSYGYKDIVIFEPDEVLNDKGQTYSVFSNYAKKWKKLFKLSSLNFYPSEKLLDKLYKFPRKVEIIPLSEIGFIFEEGIKFHQPNLDGKTLSNYQITRNFPAIEYGTTKISLHLRYGTISVREVVNLARKYSEALLNELIWREFFQSIIYHFPWIIDKSINPKFERFNWNFDEKILEKWKKGETGFPLIDAGMRELNETGYMHNRARMLSANFFTKILMHDWKIGEAYFREKLIDFDIASNVGNWQWCAGVGFDHSPYIRIFNPDIQIKRFDPNYEYIRKWIPDFQPQKYIEPIVNFDERKKKYLTTVKEVKYYEGTQAI